MNMLKNALCAVLACMMLPAVAGAVETEGKITMEELTAWTDNYHERAMASAPLNDPTDPAAFSEDGYALIYDFAYIYADRPEMTADTVINAIVLWSEEEVGPRGVRVDQDIQQALTFFYNENETLDGSWESALLYISDLMPEEAGFGTLLRDGQRIGVVQYSVFEGLEEGGYSDAGLLLTVQDGVISAVRVYGLNGVATEEEVKAAL